MSDALFSMLDYAEPMPAHADGCMYCHQDDNGRATSAAAQIRIGCCSRCPTGSPSAASWERGKLVCVRLDLNLNHWAYAMRHGYREPVSPAGDLCIRLGWRFAPDGYAIAPEGWPPGDVDSMRPIEAASHV